MFGNNKISNTHNKSKSIKVYDIKQFLIATIVTFTCFYCYYSVIETIKPSTLAATFQSYQHTNTDLNINLSPDISILTNIPKSSTTTTTTTTTASNNLFTSNHVCAGNNIAAYFNVTEGSNNQMMMDLQWCQDTVRTHKVEIGRSWGSLGREGKTRWDQVNCNEYV